MATKKRLKKKQIREDQLVTMTVRASQFVQDHFTQVISGVIVLVAAIGVILFTANVRRNSASAAEREFAVALNTFQLGDKESAATTFRNITDRYSSQDVGRVSLYFLAECYLDQLRYDEAMIAYDRYLEAAGEKGIFKTAAVVGKAMCFEGLQQYRQGADLLAELAQRMQEDDPRYMDVCFQAATMYQNAGEREKAIDYFKIVSEGGSGAMQERSDVWLAVLR